MMNKCSIDYSIDIQSKVVASTGRFEGKTIKTSSNERVEVYLVDGAVEVTDLSEKVRKAALEGFEKGIFSKAIGALGGLSLACTFIVMPVSSLIGYRIAGSHLAHAAVAFATFILGLALIAVGLGDSSEELKEKEFLENSLLSQVRAARISAGKSPFAFLLNKSDYYQYFHPTELLCLMNDAKSENIIEANTPKKKAEALLGLSKLFNNHQFNLYVGKEGGKVAANWQGIISKWQNLELDKPREEAEAKKSELTQKVEQAKNITRAPGNLIAGTANLVDKEKDPTGAAILGGMGTAFNFLVDNSINREIDAEVAKSMAGIDQAMHEAIASKWDAAMAIFEDIRS
jgi:hypothetical protein